MSKSLDHCGCERDADTYQVTAVCRRHQPRSNGLPRRWQEVETPQLQEACEKASNLFGPILEMYLRNVRKQQ